MSLAINKLPDIAAVQHPHGDRLVLVQKGSIGFWEKPEHIDASVLNSGLSERQIEAMRTCSILGWDEHIIEAELNR